jgi:hypothetical protein
VKGGTVKVLLKMDGRTEAGGSALLMHNERLADPLDAFPQAIAAVSKKRNKTTADHRDMARLEFFGGLYTTPAYDAPEETLPAANDGHVPCLPAWNVVRCLQDGAKRHKRGSDVPRGIHPLAQVATLIYDGPNDPRELWTDGGYALRKTVGVQRARTVRTRPMFTDWRGELAVEVDPVVFDVHTLRVAWKDAGLYCGIGDMRPIQGRFVGTIEVVES